jgi:hypothetical protein
MEVYRRPTDALRAKLVDLNVKILGSDEESKGQLGVDSNVARQDRHGDPSLFIQCGQNWCDNEEAAATLTTIFNKHVKQVRVLNLCPKEEIFPPRNR